MCSSFCRLVQVWEMFIHPESIGISVHSMSVCPEFQSPMSLNRRNQERWSSFRESKAECALSVIQLGLGTTFGSAHIRSEGVVSAPLLKKSTRYLAVEFRAIFKQTKRVRQDELWWSKEWTRTRTPANSYLMNLLFAFLQKRFVDGSSDEYTWNFEI